MAGIWSEMAVSELGLGNQAKALELLKQAEKVNLEKGAMPSYQICVANIGNVYCHQGNYLKAIAHNQRALNIAREIKDPVSIHKWSHNIEIAFSKIKEQSANTPSAALPDSV
jgi:tetratricopeptide (TPR) repeat protein